MTIIAHYKNSELQHLGWQSLAKYRPRKSLIENNPILSIDTYERSDDVENEIIQTLKRKSKPFLIERVREAR